MSEILVFRDTVLAALKPLDGRLDVSATQPETFTVLIQTVQAIRRSLADTVMKTRVDKRILTELGRLFAALVNIERSAESLKSWLGREADDGAFGMSPMAGQQYREAVADYLKQLCAFKEAFEPPSP
ncbi:hypothetical protein HZC53_00490 [Candidatus Uhrbacteria bacterium]|nr:hypothetical protein [Candidatus Uhrbacteria bacterium]